MKQIAAASLEDAIALRDRLTVTRAALAALRGGERISIVVDSVEVPLPASARQVLERDLSGVAADLTRELSQMGVEIAQE